MKHITRNQRITEVWMQVIDHKKIAKLMAIQEVSGREMSRIVGWKSHTYMQRILRGEIRSVDPDVAVMIAATLGVGVDDLFLPRVSTETAQVAQRRSA